MSEFWKDLPDGEEPSLGELIARRDFLKRAGLTAGAAVVGAGALGAAAPTAAAPAPQDYGRKAPAINGKSYDVAVVGAGAFGGWTSYWLRKMGAKVLLIDAYGPGNSRSTSGDETRGIRTSYGDRPQGEQWMRWASRAIPRWKAWDDEWGRDLRMRLFFPTGDFIFRNDWENFSRTTRDLFVKVGVKHEVVPVDVVRKEYPQFDLTGIGVALYESDAGVVRARRACQCVAEVFQKMGGDLLIARAYPGLAINQKADGLLLHSHDTVRAGQYVFACGPWLGKVFPSVMGIRMRMPIGQVCYFATPVADDRYAFPNMPSFNFPGVTGWPALPMDNRGLRVRGGTNPGGGGGGGGRGRGGGGGGGGGDAGGRGGGGFGAGPVGPEQDPDLSNRFVDLPSQTRSRNFLAERIPGLRDAPLNETRACHYESSISRNFVVDRHPEMSNVWIAGAGNAEGFKFGPVIGEYIARRVLGKDLEPELAEGFRIPRETYDDVVAAGAGQGDD
jgi:glycine/D-amino acid oxidase-like deaminating enzyme